MKGKSKLVTVGIILAVVILLFSTFAGAYNNLVNLDEQVEGQWSQVEAQLKRRADLIPSLVNTVKGYASQEKEVLTEITEARSSFNNANSPEELAQANGQLNSALTSLYAVAENYPDLKSNENFRDLQVSLEGTENRIATQRMRYNETVETYNSRVRKFPTNLIAGMLGFNTREYFEINEEDAEAPEVNF